jgi:hypothetical protein
VTERRIGKVILLRDQYVKNRGAWPLEELAKYGGQWVAWAPDGASIVAHHHEFGEVARKVDEMGIAPEDVLFEQIPVGGEVDLW